MRVAGEADRGLVVSPRYTSLVLRVFGTAHMQRQSVTRTQRYQNSLGQERLAHASGAYVTSTASNVAGPAALETHAVQGGTRGGRRAEG
jgi:hypothetical protein